MRLEQTRQEAGRLVAQAEAMVRDPALQASAALDLTGRLKKHFEFDVARRLLMAASKTPSGDIRSPLYRRITTELSLCTYKDEQLPPDQRFQTALSLLEGVGLRDPQCRDPEVLGQGGAVYKRMWEFEGQVEFLTMALAFYRAGWQRNPKQDLGYCAVNAAFILDILADRARSMALRTGTDDTLGSEYRAEASSIREEVLAQFPGDSSGMPVPLGYWHAATLGEAAWGLQRWTDAAQWFRQAHGAPHDEWALQATVRQLVATAHFQCLSLDKGAARSALEILLGGSADAVLSANRGKVGLALSGGGFRASLYHLGVLARLAECDALRSVEVLSTVSGGSIIGAHYYLALRELLESRADDEITREDYVALVQRLIPQFLDGVQQNLRVRTFAKLGPNFRMLFGRNYTRSNRIGELYEQYLFRHVKPGKAPGERRTMDELKIEPAQSTLPGAAFQAGFHPRFSNWRRASKVPVLLLNTTSLNSGHNWQFTASWMGEPPGLVGDEIDMNARYRRLYYSEAPTEAMQKFPLGYAVAASASVPALFSPLSLNGLYPGRVIELVDGGVHDNQGVAGLLDEGCNFILCSDASGQMDDQAKPAGGMLGVFFRSDGILQDRVREAQLEDLRMRVKSRALHGMMYVHLKQELGLPPLSWIDCKNPPQEPQRSTRTSYGVDRDIQQKISEMRTDLDSFTEVEAYSLMASGYQATARQLEQLDDEYQLTNPGQRWGGFDVHAPRASSATGAGAWPFAALFDIIGKEPASPDLRRHDLGIQLAVSRELFGKVWRLHGTLQGIAVAAVIAVLALIAYEFGLHAGEEWPFAPQFTLSTNGILAAIIGALAVFGFPVLKFVRIRKADESWAVRALAASFGWIACNIHLAVFDGMFLRRGSLQSLLRLGGEASPKPLMSPLPDNQAELATGQSTGELVVGHEELDTVKH
jgi:predicted acylesterase/phospholipase RssA